LPSLPSDAESCLSASLPAYTFSTSTGTSQHHSQRSFFGASIAIVTACAHHNHNLACTSLAPASGPPRWQRTRTLSRVRHRVTQAAAAREGGSCGEVQALSKEGRDEGRGWGKATV
jgi:hypothetical protein